MKGFKLVLIFLSFAFFTKAQVVQSISITGNRSTKEKIILRELTFQVGDTILISDTLDTKTSSENNLFNTNLFNFTKVQFNDSLGNWNVKVELQERWYIWPEVLVKFQERNFSEWWKNKNLSRLDVGLHLNKFNVFGLNQTFQINGYYGFTESIGFQYKIPYLNKKLTNGAKIAVNYSTQNEVFTDIEQNEMVYIKNDSTPIRSSFNLQLEYFRRTGFYQTQYYNARYIQLKSFDTLSNYSKHYFGNENDFLSLVNLSYRYKYDKRFSQNYPLRGYFFDVQIDQFGLGNLDKSNLFITRILGSYRYYKDLGHRQYWASGIHFNQYLTNNIPFNFQSGLGFNNYVRGYEPYVIFGTSSFLLKSNYKIALVKPKQYTLPLIKKIKKFSKIHFAAYWNLYFDAGYVINNTTINSPYINKALIGGGTGIDWVTYYDVVIRTEYSINQFGKSNFNLSFVAPI